jgi:solute carrier family 25 S-adenosylmethionine transporter 26
LDVTKTRLMIGKDKNGIPYLGFVDTCKRLQLESEFLAQQAGLSSIQAQGKIFLAGLGPRVMWISIGGFVFFGAYEQSLRLVQYTL